MGLSRNKNQLSRSTPLSRGDYLNKRAELSRSSGKLNKNAAAGSTRSFGNKLEDHIKSCAEEWGFKIKSTRNSGALHGDGDLIIEHKSNQIRIEAKNSDRTKGLGVRESDWNKICDETIKHGGTPALVTRKKDGDALVTMKLKDILSLLNG